MQPSGGSWIYKTLFSLEALQGAYDRPAMDASGNLYGTVVGGGVGLGNIFKISPGGGGCSYTDLHDFNFQNLNRGFFPVGGVVLDVNGNIYGTTQSGGNQDQNCGEGCGVGWKIAP